MLAMGGLALGEAVTSSGLLLTIAKGVSEAVEGLNDWLVQLIFCALVLVATTFISHTVGAMVILPIVQTVGSGLAVSPSIAGEILLTPHVHCPKSRTSASCLDYLTTRKVHTAL